MSRTLLLSRLKQCSKTLPDFLTQNDQPWAFNLFRAVKTQANQASHLNFQFPCLQRESILWLFWDIETFSKELGNHIPALQVRIGNVVEMDGKLVQVIRSAHGAGQGRQLGNVQVRDGSILKYLPEGVVRIPVLPLQSSHGLHMCPWLHADGAA